jgi:hypothetical protein
MAGACGIDARVVAAGRGLQPQDRGTVSVTRRNLGQSGAVRMSIEILRDVLAWSAVINLGLLAWWFVFFILAHDWMHGLHGRWFKLSAERFDAIHYAGMLGFKLGIILLNIVPYLALRIVV